MKITIDTSREESYEIRLTERDVLYILNAVLRYMTKFDFSTLELTRFLEAYPTLKDRYPSKVPIEQWIVL